LEEPTVNGDPFETPIVTVRWQETVQEVDVVREIVDVDRSVIREEAAWVQAFLMWLPSLASGDGGETFTEVSPAPL
jgi:hypothetical protein